MNSSCEIIPTKAVNVEIKIHWASFLTVKSTCSEDNAKIISGQIIPIDGDAR